MEEFQKVFEVKSKLKNYQIKEFLDFKSFLDYATTFNLLVVDKSLEGYFESIFKGIYYIECTEHTKSWEKLKDILDIFIAYF